MFYSIISMCWNAFPGVLDMGFKYPSLKAKISVALDSNNYIGGSPSYLPSISCLKL